MARKTPEQKRQEREAAEETWRQFKAVVLIPLWRWFRRLPGQVQAAVWLIGVVAVGYALFFNGGSKKETSSSASSDTSATDVSFVSGNCGQDFVVGNLDFVVVLRNGGTSPVDVEITPVRHYQDGSTNRSPLDTMYDAVPADGQPHTFWHSYDVQPDHVLITCEAAIAVGGSTRLVELPVNT